MNNTKSYVVTLAYKELRPGDVVELVNHSDFVVYINVDYVKSIWSAYKDDYRHYHRSESMMVSIEEFNKHFAQYFHEM